jgi:hypothetical protein
MMFHFETIDLFFNMQATRTRGIRRDYRALNDGSDEEEGFAIRKIARIDVQAVETDKAGLPIDPIPDDGVSQVEVDGVDLYAGAENSPEPKEDNESYSVSKNIRSPSSWVWQYYDVTTIEGRTYRDGKTEKEKRDRRISCNRPRCPWFTLDSKRGSSTSNLTTHLYKSHGISKSKFQSSIPPSDTTQSTLDSWTKPKVAPQAQLEQNIIRWIVMDTQPFTTIDHPDFKRVSIYFLTQIIIELN